jgi:hypothetical protein
MGIKLKGDDNCAKFIFTFCFSVITSEQLPLVTQHVKFGMELEEFHT